jgi:hypothetical protein
MLIPAARNGFSSSQSLAVSRSDQAQEQGNSRFGIVKEDHDSASLPEEGKFKRLEHQEANPLILSRPQPGRKVYYSLLPSDCLLC